MLRTLATLLLLLTLLSGCVATMPDNTPTQVLVPVLYATNRDLSSESERADLSFGEAVVALSPRKQGDSPFADWSRWAVRTDAPRRRNELLDVAPLEVAEFGAALDAVAARPRSVLLFVHGYRRSFTVVAREMAEFAYETNLDSVPVFFSWPSANSVFGYAGDATSVRWAAADLRDTLKLLLGRDAVDTVHIVAHSLGNSGVLEALDDLSRDPNARIDKLGEIVFASPDVDVGLFRRDFLPMLDGLGARVTLYATENDVPLQASQRVNRYQRLGDAKAKIFIEEGVETVVFSDVVTFLNSHDAVVEIGALQADMHYLLVERIGASGRPTLEAVDTERGRYWRARPLGYSNAP